jgi:hypothetical protein
LIAKVTGAPPAHVVALTGGDGTGLLATLCAFEQSASSQPHATTQCHRIIEA